MPIFLSKRDLCFTGTALSYQDSACAVTERMLCGDGRHNLNAALKIMNKPSAKS